MSLIPLRSYHNDIDKLIDRSLIDEAVAHCRHILTKYPKCVATYKLLAKAYLENKNYTEASDIFSRVISVYPDDFISHIGLSVIKEDTGNLDAAIWHMELAFDLQPTNLAVQEELRRLFGRRDGVQPKKIGLTRGALIRMYARGDLYQQAIAEIQSVLEEDPKRIDLEVILARMYYQSGAYVEAADICNRVLRRSPYNFETNQILTCILPKTAQAENSKIYKERLIALDPYFQFVTSPELPAESVADDKVQVEKLVYNAAEFAGSSQNWSNNLGLQWDNEPQNSTPSWLSDLKNLQETETSDESVAESPLMSDFDTTRQFPGSQEKEESKSISSSNENVTPPQEIPDWMRNAGWMPSTGDSVPESNNFESPDEDQPVEVKPPLPADLPDWLKNAATSDRIQEMDNEAETENFEEIPIINVSGESEINEYFPEDVNKEISSFEFDKSALPSIDQNESQTSTIPEEVGEKMLSDNSSSENNEWLNQLRSDSSQPEDISNNSDSDLPDWLRNFEEEQKQPSKQEDDLPTWLKSLQETTPSAPQEPEEPSTQPESENELSQPNFEQEEQNPQDNLDSILNDQSKLFTRILGESERAQTDAGNGYLAPESHPLPKDWENDVIEEESVDQPQAEPQVSSEIPDWVRNALKISSSSTNVIEESIETPAPTPESFQEPDLEIGQSGTQQEAKLVSPEPVVEGVSGAISDETNNELLDWLRSMNTDETSESAEALESTEEVSEEQAALESEFSITDRLNNLNVSGTMESTSEESLETKHEEPSEPVVSFVRGSEPEIQPEYTPEPDAGVIPTSISENQFLSAQSFAETGKKEPSSVDPLLTIDSLITEGNTVDAVEQYSLLLKENADLSLIENSVRSNIDKHPEQFELWQVLGDVLARSDRLDDALLAYEKAESILLQNQ